jgi:hypothetical protein
MTLELAVNNLPGRAKLSIRIAPRAMRSLDILTAHRSP